VALQEHELAVARAAKGFMPDDEGAALHEAALDGGRVGPLLEIGSYCGKSGVYLGAAARERDTVLFTIDHHRGSEENQAGWEHHDTSVVDERIGKMDTLPFARATIHDAGLEGSVIMVVGPSNVISRQWHTPVGLLFIDGGHAEDIAMGDYESWSRFIAPGGLLAIHDVFERPEDGGQAPFHVWQRAVADGFVPVDELGCGSLRVVRRPD
jgi:predicted O-methyltransferase YrrM